MCFFAGCATDPLYYPSQRDTLVEVMFDWRFSPEASPEGMILYFFPIHGGEIYRFELSGYKSGLVSLPEGVYDVLAYNSDAANIDFIMVDSLDAAFGRLMESKKYSGFSASTTPLYTGFVRNQRIEPGDCGCSVKVDYSNPKQRLTVYPRNISSRYRVRVNNVENLNGISEVWGAVDGLSQSILLASGKGVAAVDSIAFPMKAENNVTLTGEMLNFGKSDRKNIKNKLTIFTVLTDKRRLKFVFDVTDQVDDASDPRDVLIEIDNLKLPASNPKDPVGEGGIKVGVDDWETVNIEIKN